MRTNCHKVLKIPNNFKKLDGISYSVQINDGKQEGNEIRLFPYSLQNLSSLKKFLPEDSTGNVSLFCLHSNCLDFNIHRLRSLLNTKTIGSGFIYFREVESTMDVSKAIELYAPSGTLILAEIQTQGKGREERPWVGKGGNLYFTLILKLSPYDLAKLNFSASLSVAQTCVDFGI
jgi:hypothetical protein